MATAETGTSDAPSHPEDTDDRADVLGTDFQPGRQWIPRSAPRLGPPSAAEPRSPDRGSKILKLAGARSPRRKSGASRSASTSPTRCPKNGGLLSRAGSGDISPERSLRIDAIRAQQLWLDRREYKKCAV